jgi:hypothetical protein
MGIVMLGVQVLLLLVLVWVRVWVRVRVVGTAMLGDLLLLLTVMLGDLLRLLLVLVRVVERTMKAAAGTQALDEIVLVRIRKKTGTTGTRMHHRVRVLL